MTLRYTPDQLLGMAGYYENNGGDKTTGAMLRQAASDAARIAELEAEIWRLEKSMRHARGNARNAAFHILDDALNAHYARSHT